MKETFDSLIWPECMKRSHRQTARFVNRGGQQQQKLIEFYIFDARCDVVRFTVVWDGVLYTYFYMN